MKYEIIFSVGITVCIPQDEKAEISLNATNSHPYDTQKRLSKPAWLHILNVHFNKPPKDLENFMEMVVE